MCGDALFDWPHCRRHLLPGLCILGLCPLHSSLPTSDCVGDCANPCTGSWVWPVREAGSTVLRKSWEQHDFYHVVFNSASETDSWGLSICSVHPWSEGTARDRVMKVGKKLPFGILSHCKLGIACYCSLTQAFLTGSH